MFHLLQFQVLSLSLSFLPFSSASSSSSFLLSLSHYHLPGVLTCLCWPRKVFFFFKVHQTHLSEKKFVCVCECECVFEKNVWKIGWGWREEEMKKVEMEEMKVWMNEKSNEEKRQGRFEREREKEFCGRERERESDGRCVMKRIDYLHTDSNVRGINEWWMKCGSS